MVDAKAGGAGRGASRLLFFMFTRPQPYTCLGIEWLTPRRAARAAARVVYYFSCLQGPNPTPVWELNERD